MLVYLLLLVACVRTYLDISKKKKNALYPGVFVFPNYVSRKRRAHAVIGQKNPPKKKQHITSFIEQIQGVKH